VIDNGTVDAIIDLLVLSNITLAGNPDDDLQTMIDLLSPDVDVDIAYAVKRFIMMVPHLNEALIVVLKANHPKYVAMAEKLMVLS